MTRILLVGLVATGLGTLGFAQTVIPGGTNPQTQGGTPTQAAPNGVTGTTAVPLTPMSGNGTLGPTGQMPVPGPSTVTILGGENGPNNGLVPNNGTFQGMNQFGQNQMPMGASAPQGFQPRPRNIVVPLPPANFANNTNMNGNGNRNRNRNNNQFRQMGQWGSGNPMGMASGSWAPGGPPVPPMFFTDYDFATYRDYDAIYQKYTDTGGPTGALPQRNTPRR